MSASSVDPRGWDQVDVALDEYVEAWVTGERPDPEAFCREHEECGDELRSRLRDLLHIEEELQAQSALQGSAAGRSLAVRAFLRRYSQDREAGQVQSLEAYAARFPGDLDGLAQEFLAREGKLRDPESSGARLRSGAAAEAEIGPYRLIRELGRGGQGIVYLAEDRRLHRQVALKLLNNVGPVPEAILKRFWREAEVASRLEHPGICAVHDAGTAQEGPYIVMRYVEGETLAARIARCCVAAERASAGETGEGLVQRWEETPSTTTSTTVNREEISRLVELFEKVSRALHAAHQAQVIHRDMKPGNIIVTPESQPVIMDFGLARLEGEDLPSITDTGALFGTPPYMSPEQLSDRKVRLDRRTDIWSLGVALFESLALQRPFRAPTRQALYQAILIDDPPDLHRLNRAVSKDLEAVVDTALAKSRDDRYQTALDLACDLRRVRDGEPITAKRITAAGRTLRWARREPTKALLLLVLLLTLPAISMLVTYSVATRPEVERHRLWLAEAERERRLEGGYALLVERAYDDAICAFEAGLRLDPRSSEAVAGIAIAHLRARRPEEALAVLAGNEAVFGERPALALLRREALMALGRSDEAPALTEAPPPRDSLDYYLLAVHLSHLGSQHGDLDAWRRALAATTRALFMASGPRFLLYVQRAHVAGHAADPEAARDIAEALRTRWGGQASAHGWAGYALGNAGLHDEAAACFEDALAIDGKDLSCLLGLGNQLRATGKTKDAIRYYRLAIAIDPEAFRVYHALGHALKALGERDEAIDCFRNSLQGPRYEDRDSAYALICLANALDDQGHFEEAIQYYEEALVIFPDFPRLHYEIGVALARQGKIDDAVDRYRKALEYEFAGRPYDPPVTGEDLHGLRSRKHQHYGWVHLNLGGILCDVKRKYDEAIAHFQKVLEYEPDNLETLMNIGIASCRMGRSRDAADALERVVDLDPRCAVAFNLLGVAYLGLERWDDATECFDQAIVLNRDYANARANRCLPPWGHAKCLMNEGHFADALAELRIATKLAAGLQISDTIGETLDECEKLIALEGRLPEIARGTARPRSPADAIALADVATKTRRHARAAQLYRDAFAASPALAEDLWEGGHRFHAASDAVLAGCGKDPEIRDPELMRAWRQQARAWLGEDLAALRKLLEAPRVPERRIMGMLAAWKKWPALAEVRDEALLASLPEPEQAAWRELWRAVDALAAEIDPGGDAQERARD